MVEFTYLYMDEFNQTFLFMMKDDKMSFPPLKDQQPPLMEIKKRGRRASSMWRLLEPLMAFTCQLLSPERRRQGRQCPTTCLQPPQLTTLH